MENKKVYIIIGIVCLILGLYTIWQFTFPNPFGGIRDALWEWEHRNTDKTTILIRGNKSIEL